MNACEQLDQFRTELGQNIFWKIIKFKTNLTTFFNTANVVFSGASFSLMHPSYYQIMFIFKGK